MRLAWFLTWRDIRQGGATLLCLALVISVTAVSAVGLLADRVRQALASDAQATLAADLVLVSDRSPPLEWREQIQQRGLRLVEGSQFPTMAQTGTGDNMRGLLVALKTVTAGYPLRGTLLLQTENGRISNGTLGLDEVWIDPALAATLNVQIGDRLTIGALSFKVAALIIQEPDRGMNFVNLSPRVMIRHEAVARGFGAADIIGEAATALDRSHLPHYEGLSAEERVRCLEEQVRELEAPDERMHALEEQVRELEGRLGEAERKPNVTVILDDERNALQEAVAAEVRRPLTSILGITLALKHTDSGSVEATT